MEGFVMTDELRAAADGIIEQGTAWLARGDGWGRLAADMILVARAYLAEHPTDDTELLTADWLRSVGFTEDPTDGMFLRIPFPGSLYPAYLCVCSDPNSAIDGGNAMFTSYDRRKDGSDDLDTEDMVVTGKNVIRTRGDVRRLLVAFKIGIPS